MKWGRPLARPRRSAQGAGRDSLDRVHLLIAREKSGKQTRLTFDAHCPRKIIQHCIDIRKKSTHFTLQVQLKVFIFPHYCSYVERENTLFCKTFDLITCSTVKKKILGGFVIYTAIRTNTHVCVVEHAGKPRGKY